MTVSELIEVLAEMPQDWEVAMEGGCRYSIACIAIDKREREVVIS
jgi:hypothetical protein